jgi:hypothetical protein
MIYVPTTGTHLFSPLTYSYSVPSSVSRIHLSSSLEKEIRGSLLNSEGDWGKPDNPVSVGFCVSSIAVRMSSGNQ